MKYDVLASRESTFLETQEIVLLEHSHLKQRWRGHEELSTSAMFRNYDSLNRSLLRFMYRSIVWWELIGDVDILLGIINFPILSDFDSRRASLPHADLEVQ